MRFYVWNEERFELRLRRRNEKQRHTGTYGWVVMNKPLRGLSAAAARYRTLELLTKRLFYFSFSSSFQTFRSKKYFFPGRCNRFRTQQQRLQLGAEIGADEKQGGNTNHHWTITLASRFVAFLQDRRHCQIPREWEFLCPFCTNIWWLLGARWKKKISEPCS